MERELTGAWNDNFANTVTLGNCADRIRRWYRNVALACCDGALRVTESEPVRKVVH